MSHDEFSAEERRQLVEQYTEIARLAGGLAHEIKNPLSTIRLNVALLAEDFEADDSPRGKRTLAKIHVVMRECQRLENLLNDFLRFARVRDLELEPVDLNVEVAATLDFLLVQFREAGVEAVRFFDPDLPSVRLNREAFRAALLNLLLNAQQALPDGGTIVVRTRTTAFGVALDLIDNGAGMPPAVLERVFQAFYSTKPGGSGLGLPTARKIVAAHRGRMTIQSEEGRGTQVTIELPTLPRLGDGR